MWHRLQLPESYSSWQVTQSQNKIGFYVIEVLLNCNILLGFIQANRDKLVMCLIKVWERALGTYIIGQSRWICQISFKIHPSYGWMEGGFSQQGKSSGEGWQRFWIENDRQCKATTPCSRLSSNIRYMEWGEEHTTTGKSLLHFPKALCRSSVQIKYIHSVCGVVEYGPRFAFPSRILWCRKRLKCSCIIGGEGLRGFKKSEQ